LFFQSGVSSPFGAEQLLDEGTEIEKYCDRVAAEFLVPREVFVAGWNSAKSSADALRAARQKYKVSSIVILRRALDLDLIAKAEFTNLFHENSIAIQNYGKKQSAGGDYYANQGTKLGSVFTEAIYTALKTGYLQFGDAYKMTGIKGGNLDKYYKERGLVL
jgi:Zn-dependent peptidase ImmA (M78 family)